jgi:peptidoglycan hydrolase-like protein with peptidoglycan-binding domain
VPFVDQPDDDAAEGRETRIGERGLIVGRLQHRLANLSDGYAVAVDCEFGPRTEAVVKLFQLDYGLPITGVATAEVWLGIDTAVAEIPSNISSEPFECPDPDDPLS